MKAQEAAWDSPRYHALLTLRESVLRTPLGLTLSAADLAQDVDQRHFGIWEDENLAVACAIAAPLSEKVWKIRQMAVAPPRRNQGLGRLVVQQVTETAGVQEFVLHAREEAMPFYLRLGFQAEGTPFLEVGLTHFLMKKRLPAHG